MKPWTSWFARLGLAGVCLAWVGCGGSDVPDPDSDTSASAEGVPGGGESAPPPVAAAPEGMPGAPGAAMPGGPPGLQPGMPGAPGASMPGAPPVAGAGGPRPGGGAGGPPPAASTAAAAPAGEGEVPGGKPTEKSGTAELLALASAPTAGVASAEGGAPPAGGASQPGEAAVPGAPGEIPGGPPGGGYPGAGGPPGYPGRRGPETLPGAPPGTPEGYPSPGAPPGGEGIPGGIPGFAPPGGGEGLGGGADVKSDFTTPFTGCASFLSALKAKDAERLAEATALRAPTEATTPANQKLFTSIREQSLAAEDLDELAKKLDGMSVVGQNQAKSSGKLGVIVGKSGPRGEYFTRTITMRREKDGWKVVDISGQREFERPISSQPRGGVRKGR